MSKKEEKSSDKYYYDEEEEQPNESDQDWILDTIVEYLKSPMLKNPILAFIDKYCASFDSDDENKFEYTTIHKVSDQIKH